MFMLIGVALAGIFVVWLWMSTKRPENYPPGPPLLPFFGNLLQLAWRGRTIKHKYKIMEELIEKYGDVVGLRMVKDDIVLVSGMENIKEVMWRDEFNGRPDGFAFLHRSYGQKLGIIFNDGDAWTEQRRFALKLLRNFGFGKRSMEATISEEINDLIETIKLNSLSKPLNMNRLFTFPIINILWVIIGGKKFSTTDKRHIKLFDLTEKMVRSFEASGGVLDQLPWIRHIIPDLSGFTPIKLHTIEIQKFIAELLDEHIRTLNPEEPRDVIDSYLIEMNKYEGQTSIFTRKEISTVCDDFFEAGSDTTKNSLAFFLLYMLKYPEVQKKIQKEIDAVIGKDQQPTVAHRLDMAYTEAVIMETTRLSPVFPLLVPHKALATAKLKNYTIKKGTMIVMCLNSLHRDPHWKDPSEFRPERFIGENGKVILDDYLLPFGLGKRRCIGETLARSVIFLFAVSLLQKFDMRSPENEPPPSFEGVDGITQTPQQFRAIFTLRAH